MPTQTVCEAGRVGGVAGRVVAHLLRLGQYTNPARALVVRSNERISEVET
jgi:hypothetical protein